jgi:hypothetical protein
VLWFAPTAISGEHVMLLRGNQMLSLGGLLIVGYFNILRDYVGFGSLCDAWCLQWVIRQVLG